MAVSLKQFTKHLSECGVLSEKQLRTFQEKNPPYEEAEDLAKALVQQKKLTKFQAQLLYQGKGKGLLLGDYLILDKIGAGGMGQVYLAEHRRMGRKVALKTLPARMTKDQRAINRFQREVQAAAKLSHGNIVTAFDAGEANGIHYFVMEHVIGQDLSDMVKETGPLSVAQAVELVKQAAQGLEYAHNKGVVHRDIKPANTLLDTEGTVKILDMGLARIDAHDEEQDDDQTNLTETGAIMGTVDYMAPEQALDTKQADARSDIYSLGCMLHYLLTSKSVYGGDTILKKLLAHREQAIPSLTDARKDIPAKLNSLFQKMVAKDPKDRQQTMTQVIADLETCGALETAHAASPDTSVSLDPAFKQFLKDRDMIETPTLDNSPAAKVQVASPRETLPSGFLDETLTTAGAVPERLKQQKFKLPYNLQYWHLSASGLLLLIIAIWASGVFLKVNTPAGTIILEIDQAEMAGAIVSVDGEQKITIQTGQGKEPIEVTADEKTHTLKVVKGGFEAFTKEFTVKAGGKQTIRVRLEPIAGKHLEMSDGSLSERRLPLQAHWAKWSTAHNLGSNVNSKWKEEHPSVSSDGLTLLFASNRPNGQGGDDIWMSTRASVEESFGPAVNLGADINSSIYDSDPELSSDGLTLFFASNRRNGGGDWDIWMCHRQTLGMPFEKPTLLDETINTTELEGGPAISRDGKTLIFHRGTKTFDLWTCHRSTLQQPFTGPKRMKGGINSPAWQRR